MKTTYGTCHFVSYDHALWYYSDYHYDDPHQAVSEKIHRGEIRIGKPALKPGQTLSVIDDGTRYAITEPEISSAT